MKKKITVVSGGFDPIHSGHIAYLEEARRYGDVLIVLLNSDTWLENKKGKFFLPFVERKIILENLKLVDAVFGFEDDEKGSCINGLKEIKNKFPKDKIIFCKGGDRTRNNIPEMDLKDITFKFEVGGNFKKNSSSKILKNWNNHSETRVWGSFNNLFVGKKLKVKELIINPKKGMSFQRHSFRNELWFVSEGSCIVNYSKTNKEEQKEHRLAKDDIFQVKKNEWHQIINPYKKVCKIIEIQYGDRVQESDIERLYYFDEDA